MNIPIFDITKPISIPKWPGCIHRFAKLFDLHRELARHCRLLLSRHQICEAFLENIRVLQFQNMVDNCLVNLHNVVSVDPLDGTL